MKKTIAVILTICFAVCLTACRNIEATQGTTGNTSHTTSNPNTIESTSDSTEASTSSHTHTYAAASCSEPAKCACGAVKGDALGHSYSKATCTEAPKCSRCGESSGSALGHSWQAATCKAPKTCSVCKKTSGSVGGHTYISGVCIHCGGKDAGITLAEARQIAEKLISKYHQYVFLGVCCDCSDEDFFVDMSGFLIQEQRNYYLGSQYRITCCSSAFEAKQHIGKYIDKDAEKNGYFDGMRFFYGNNNKLYVMISAKGVLGYGDVSIDEYTATRIVAKVAIVDIDGPTGVYDVFVMEKKGSDFIITSVA